MLDTTSPGQSVPKGMLRISQEMSSSEKLKEDEIKWSVNTDILFFNALQGHKPVGINRHFMMILIHNKFCSSIKQEISTETLWNHLDSLYDLAALHESEILPFPNDEVDFELPEDCYELLHSKHGVKLERKKSSEDDDQNLHFGSSKSPETSTPRLKQNGRPTDTLESDCASPVNYSKKPARKESSVNGSKPMRTESLDSLKKKKKSELGAKSRRLKKIEGQDNENSKHAGLDEVSKKSPAPKRRRL